MSLEPGMLPRFAKAPPSGWEAAPAPGDPTCANCGLRAGRVRWGDSLAMTHGFATWWCETCAYEAQLVHAIKRAVRIPVLAVKWWAAAVRWR